MVIRRIVFKIFYLLWSLLYIVASPLLLFPPRYALKVCQIWGRGVTFLLRWIAGIKQEIRGLEKLPQGGVIVASKHQSEWETFVLGYLVNQPIFILKKELLKVPFFGWYIWRTKMIAVDRKAKGGIMRQMINQALPRLQEGKTIVIFPEGTRTPIGKKSKYKQGVAALYEASQVPVYPVALNSGAIWAKGKFKCKGTIIIEFLDPIYPGLSSEEFMQQLENVIENASQKLYEETLKE